MIIHSFNWINFFISLDMDFIFCRTQFLTIFQVLGILTELSRKSVVIISS